MGCLNCHKSSPVPLFSFKAVSRFDCCRREDLDLQCALQPLKVLHQSIYQYRWKKRMLPFPDCVPVERNSAFRFVDNRYHVLHTLLPQVKRSSARDKSITGVSWVFFPRPITSRSWSYCHSIGRASNV